MARVSSIKQRIPKQNILMRAFATGLVLVSASACSSIRTSPPKDLEALEDYRAANDAYEPLNRKMFDFNSWLYHHGFRAVGRAWKNNIPKPVRQSVANVNQTWQGPSVFFSDVGAGNPRRAGDSFMRFVINMTAGVAGFFDVATLAGYPYHATDPGMVMSLWGVKSGPYIFLPFLGPNNVRDALGYAVAQGLTPVNYVPRGYGLLSFNWGYNILGAFNTFADSTDQLDALEHQSLDPYAYLRSAWQQNRQSQIDALKNDHRATTPDWY